MNREGALGILLIASLLLGIVLFTRRPAASSYTSAPIQHGNIRVIPTAAEPPHYRNKETRLIEYNDEGLPSKIEIIRDFTIA